MIPDPTHRDILESIHLAAKLPRGCIDCHKIPPRGADRLAALTAALWTPGQTVRIAFGGPLGAKGTAKARASVMKAAAEWMKYGNIKVAQVTSGKCEFRCSFIPGGSWSYVGHECLSIPSSQPTMNMGWPNDYGRDLHEMGHALGMIHEHQSPAAEIPWNKEAVYAFYGGSPNYWTRSEVDDQVFGRYNSALITNSSWDGKSIMQYWIPRELVTDARFALPPNEVLSATDKEWFAKNYPKPRNSFA